MKSCNSKGKAALGLLGLPSSVFSHFLQPPIFNLIFYIVIFGRKHCSPRSGCGASTHQRRDGHFHHINLQHSNIQLFSIFNPHFLSSPNKNVGFYYFERAGEIPVLRGKSVKLTGMLALRGLKEHSLMLN